MSDTPELISSVVGELWRISCKDELAVFSSPTFSKLENSCLSVYCGIPGSRLDKKPTANANPNELQTALRNFFRWNGAPWYDEKGCTAGETAQTLHRAFLSKRTNRFYLAPLDCFSLKSDSPPSQDDTADVSFGPNRILRLNSIDLDRLVRSHALPQFGSNYTFPTKDLSEFYWLLVTRNENAGPIWDRTWLKILHDGSIFAAGTDPIYRPTFPTPIEDALFVMLLTFLNKPDDSPWEPFYVPWFYSFTDDLFADATRAPDPSTLTWTIIGPPGEEFEVPDQFNRFSVNCRKLRALRQRWCKLQACLQRADGDKSNFNLLTRHFFVKGLVDHGIDQLISNVSCIEATLQLHSEKNRSEVMKRYSSLTGDKEAEWLDLTYELRKQYLHSLARPDDTVSWRDIAKSRWSLTMAIRRYLDFSNEHSELGRDELLEELLCNELN